jgi:SpoVK/Ycf46/Vps4 family AAA+-type ATPase
VGETEKNLNGLLDAVTDQPVVLLFDEADSLFGRRADVKDARDRYANMEISHLLTRIEQHRGPCLLTTNLRQHLDAAFLRRFHVVVDFPRPDAAARVALWALHLPPRAPRTDEVDPERLAQAVVLSGAQIRNAALRAAYLASAAEAPLGLPHLARAIWMELAKDGRELNPAMLGSLAEFLSEVGP